MKRRRSDRLQFKRVTQRRFFVEKLDSDEYSGHITLLCIGAVREPLWVEVGSIRACVADKGFSWLQHFPANVHYAVTTMFDSTGRVVQWYIDVCKQHGMDVDSVPWYNDLYLDIAMLPSGELEVLDADELDQALQEGSISQADHDLAWREANRLMTEIRRGSLRLLNLSNIHRSRLLRRAW